MPHACPTQEPAACPILLGKRLDTSVEIPSTRVKVAIIGGGPGGLSAAIELSKLPFVDYNLYEKKSTISETGGGISLQPHTWRLLARNDTAHGFASNDYFRTMDEEIEQRR